MSTVETLSIENDPTAYLMASTAMLDVDAIVKAESFNLSADIDTALVDAIVVDATPIRSAFTDTALTASIKTVDW